MEGYVLNVSELFPCRSVGCDSGWNSRPLFLYNSLDLTVPRRYQYTFCVHRSPARLLDLSTVMRDQRRYIGKHYCKPHESRVFTVWSECHTRAELSCRHPGGSVRKVPKALERFCDDPAPGFSRGVLSTSRPDLHTLSTVDGACPWIHPLPGDGSPLNGTQEHRHGALLRMGGYNTRDIPLATTHLQPCW